jgi:hypothetical protein
MIAIDTEERVFGETEYHFRRLVNLAIDEVLSLIPRAIHVLAGYSRGGRGAAGTQVLVAAVGDRHGNGTLARAALCSPQPARFTSTNARAGMRRRVAGHIELGRLRC